MRYKLAFGCAIVGALTAFFYTTTANTRPVTVLKPPVPFSIKRDAKPKILFTGMAGFPILDPRYRQKLAVAGYPTATATYPEIHLPTEGVETRRRPNAHGANVAVVTMAGPYDLPFAGSNQQALLCFVRQGGGLLLMVGTGGYAGTSKLWNDVNGFLSPLGAKLLFQRVHDRKHRTIFSLAINYAFYSTDNIARNNPITRGVHRLWYPGGMWRGAISTYTMKLSPVWRIIVRGDGSASSSSYRSAPPLAAVRSYGKGRIAVVTWSPKYSINDGFHPAYGGYMLGNKGDGFKFLSNLYNWLGRPSIEQGWVYSPPERPKAPAKSVGAWGTTGKTPAPAPSVSQAALIAQLKTAAGTHIYKGIIGVCPQGKSSGQATVAAFCRTARQLGLNFLVFAPAYAKMTLGQLLGATQAGVGQRFKLKTRRSPGWEGLLIRRPGRATKSALELARHSCFSICHLARVILA